IINAPPPPPPQPLPAPLRSGAKWTDGETRLLMARYRAFNGTLSDFLPTFARSHLRTVPAIKKKILAELKDADEQTYVDVRYNSITRTRRAACGTPLARGL
ncbi:hypothetical protein HK097_007155, partial [Rhizophlyctis rosea]